MRNRTPPSDRGPQRWRRDVGRNRLLQALTRAEYASLAPHLSLVALAAHQTIHDAGERPRHAYFPGTGVLSLVVLMDDGRAVEAATVGNEGLAGVSALLGPVAMTTRCLVQVAGDARRVTAPALVRAVAASPGLRRVLQRYTQSFMNQLAQSAACNGLHPLPARCARWLLMTQDRVGADSFDLTQEFLSYMLGVRREGVSAAARGLQEAGLVSYSRGRIVILGRAGLEAASCECYDAQREDYARLLG